MEQKSTKISHSSEEIGQQMSEETKTRLKEITISLMISTVILNVGVILFHLDFLLASLLGSLLVGINFYWTQSMLRRILLTNSVQTKVIALYALKFGVSVVVVYMAIAIFKLSGIGIVIGVSNIALTSFIYPLYRFVFQSPSLR